MIKKHLKIGIAAACAILITLSGCSSQDQPETTDKEPLPIKPNLTLELEKKGQWTIEQIAFENQSVSQIQVTYKGEVFVLSEGKLYSVNDKKEVKKISEREDITAFYVLESRDGIRIFYGSNNGKLFFTTLDGDEQEADLNAFEAPINKISGSALSQSVYVGQSSKYGGGLWKSDDYGKTWVQLTDTTVRGIAIHPYEPDILYIVDKQTYYSENGGESFLKINTEANYGVLISPQCPDAAYHAYSKGVFITDKKGNISSHLKFFLEGSMTRLELNPENINYWLMGIWNYPSGVGGLYTSKNSGGLWQPLDEFNNMYVHDIVYSLSGKIAYIGTKQDGIWAVNCSPLSRQDSE